MTSQILPSTFVILSILALQVLGANNERGWPWKKSTTTTKVTQTIAQTTHATTQATAKEEKHVSAGLIAGIVIACVVLLVILPVVGFILFRLLQKRAAAKDQPQPLEANRT
ncbi:hypothetical protein QBC43DRAFT_290433 [Cladorrhinum sp. PSN259]|nr:hypothetical protein QBC43DRAFT_290433 [Cladorrhinum sp. PSN259]